MKTYTLDDYEIYKDGRIFSKKQNRFIKPQPNDMGYLRVFICQKRLFVHRLVAEKYIPNPQNLPCVNHIDGNHTNNNVSNLEWCTQRYNILHSLKIGLMPTGEKCHWAKLKEKDVIYIREHPELDKKELAQKFNISVNTINDIRKYRSWKNVN